MPFAASLSVVADTAQAVAEAIDAAVADFGSGRPDVVAVFFSPHHGPDAEVIARTLADRFGPEPVVGCMGESIVASGREIEGQPALSLWLAGFGGAVEAESFHLLLDQGREGPTLFGWPDGVVDGDPTRSAMLTFADPHTFPVSELFFPRMHEDYPGLIAVGGMASGAMAPGETILIRGAEVLNIGAVGMLLRGGPRWRTVVSQGCRPIGQPLVITQGHDNIIVAVGGQPPVKYLQDLYAELPEVDRPLFQRGLHIGMVMTELKETFDRGDFLIRNLYGIDRDTGALVVTDRVRVGQTIQFQLRDAATADDDLRVLLSADRATHGPAGGALLFTCNGRGTRLFPAPDHDAKVLAEIVGPIPTAGFFAAGELGPIAGLNYLHGFTASAVLFDPI